LHTAIYHNKGQFLQQILSDFGHYINANLRSLDGWLPFELALATSNKKAIDILLSYKGNNLNLNYPTKS
jgi:ankyrin repeat protein